jgi:hypothetical protein
VNANVKALGMDTMLHSCAIYSSLKDIIETVGGWSTVGRQDRTA